MITGNIVAHHHGAQFTEARVSLTAKGTAFVKGGVGFMHAKNGEAPSAALTKTGGRTGIKSYATALQDDSMSLLWHGYAVVAADAVAQDADGEFYLCGEDILCRVNFSATGTYQPGTPLYLTAGNALTNVAAVGAIKFKLARQIVVAATGEQDAYVDFDGVNCIGVNPGT